MTCIREQTSTWLTYRNNTKTAWGKVWKLLLRLISVPSTRAILPNIYRDEEKERGRMKIGEKRAKTGHLNN